MGVVKYSGPVASFHCPTNAEIRSLKVHFSPKQEGTGDPSPENVRPISGWDGVVVRQSGKNLFNIHAEEKAPDNTSLSYVNKRIFQPNTYFVGTSYSNYIATGNASASINGNNLTFSAATGYAVGFAFALTPGEKYSISATEVQKDSGVTTIVEVANYKADGTFLGADTQNYFTGNKYFTVPQDAAISVLCFRPSGAWKTVTLTNIQLEVGTEKTAYEPYQGSTTNYEFGVLGKNKFNWNVEESISTPTGSDPAIARAFTLNTYVIGMSVNNYYRQNYTNWVLNPSVENGVISFSSGGASGYGIAFPLKLAAGQTYFLSGTGNGSVGATYYNENGELISYQNGRLNKTITVPENAATTLIGFYTSTSNTDFTFSNIQLELGSTATAYEPYDPKHTVYGGWVDLITGGVCDNWWTNTFEVTADEGTVQTSGLRRIAKSLPSTHLCDTDQRTKSVCSQLLYLSQSNDSRPNFSLSKNTAYMYIPNDNTAYTFEIFYPSLTTSATYQIAPTSMQTFLGQNNVWSNADYVEVEYDLHETQDILNRKAFIIANQPHIVKPVAASLQNFKTDMAAPLKECKVHFSPVQEGTGDPSPTNVRPISGWTGVEVYRTGKNIFGPLADGYFKCFVPTGTKLTASSNFPSSGNNQVRYSREDKSEIDYWTLVNRYENDNRSYRNFSTLENAYFWKFNNSNLDCQVEFGTSPTSYEPYSGTTIPITFPFEAGTVYGGYVDLVKGEVVAEWTSIHAKNYTWNNYSSNKIFYISKTDRTADSRDISNKLISYTGYGWNNAPDNSIISGNNTSMFIKHLGVTNSTEFKEWLDEIDPIIYYKLATPIIYSLTPQTLKTLRGTNNIWASNNGGNIEVSFWRH